MNINRLKNKSLLINIVIFSALVLPASAWSSDNIQSHNSIRDAAHNHAKNSVTGYDMPPTVTVNRLDSRLKLPKCNKPLETFSPPTGRKFGRITIGVRCSGNKPWSLYVPVLVSMNSDVVVAAHNLARGAVLSANDLMLEKRDIARLRGSYLSDPTQAIGKVLKRNLQQGRVLNSQHMIIPNTIKKGSKVIILSQSSNIQVRMPGKALSNGTMGALIKVQNINSKKELEAIVISPGVVQVAM